MANPPPIDPATELSVVLPAFNEELCIEASAREVLAFLEQHYPEHELLLVNDGSADRTGELIDGLARQFPRVVALHQPRNLGYGAALARGFRAARGRFVFYTDSDGQFDIRELLPVHRELLQRGADAAFGYRIERDDPRIRLVLSWIYNRLVRVLFWVGVRDVDCAFKLFRREVLEAMRLDARDFFIDTELVARTRKLGFKSFEVGVQHYPRRAGRTTVRPGHIPRTLWTVAKMACRIHFGASALPEAQRREALAARENTARI